MICRVCEAEFVPGTGYATGPSYPFAQERHHTVNDSSMCDDCNGAAEAHARTVDHETKTEQMERRRNAFPKTFPKRAGAF